MSQHAMSFSIASTDTLDFKIVSLSELAPDLRIVLEKFLQTVCPMYEGHYAKRLRPGVYDAVIYTENEQQGIGTVLLVNKFIYNEQRYYYLGPLVSRQQDYWQLFPALLEALVHDKDPRPICFMTEAQNPFIALLFFYILDGLMSPGLKEATVNPSRQEAILSIFADHLDHIDSINPSNLSTRASSSMFRANHHYARLVTWFQNRGIDFSAHDSQIILLDLPSSHWQRRTQIKRILARLNRLFSFHTAGEAHRFLLQWFETSIDKF
ncbi:MAG: hypothetical protein NTX25_16300 [Proteobacteria bacterium]|nr:hypothetical protein [Pseudomonadota bacterium]